MDCILSKVAVAKVTELSSRRCEELACDGPLAGMNVSRETGQETHPCGERVTGTEVGRVGVFAAT
ncbi:MAG: hypothetical protein ABIU05_12675 [Nitrospirales bacterium]